MTWLRILFVLILETMCHGKDAPRIVYPRMLDSRTEAGRKLLKITADLTLNLEKSTIFSDEFLVHSTLDGTPITYPMLGAQVEKNLYHDTKQMASLDVSDKGGLRIEGTLGHTLRIKPVPEEERSLHGDMAHMLYHADEPLSREDHRPDYGPPPDENGTRSPIVESRAWKSKKYLFPPKIYPEIHVVVDFLLCQALKFRVAAITKYIAIMGNAANLRFLSMREPRVKLRIVGVTVTMKEKDEPYMVYPQGYTDTNNILFFKTLQSFNEHVKQKAYFASSDVVFLLTARNLSTLDGTVLKPWYGGYTHIGGACTQWKVGMSEEQAGSFYGVFFFAHEIAHSLGCAHDGRAPETWPAGLIGSEDCPWDTGYMMSYKFKSPYMFTFSECCQREVMNLYIRPQHKCLREKNTRETGVHSSRLPGEVSSRQTFCRKVYYQYKYVEVDRNYNMTACIVKCYIDNKRWNNMLIAAVDGVKCGPNKVCALGQCIERSEVSKVE